MTAAVPEHVAAQPTESAAPDERAAMIEALRAQLAPRLAPGSRAHSGAAELAVVVTESVADPALDVFWDRADHALAYDLLLRGVAAPEAPQTPGRAASQAAVIPSLSRICAISPSRPPDSAIKPAVRPCNCSKRSKPSPFGA